MPDFLPRREAELLQWSANFDRQINDAPGDFGLSVQVAADYRALHEAFAQAYQLSQEPSTRTASAVVAKDDAKAALLALARGLARVVRGQPGVTDAQRLELGLVVRRSGRLARVAAPAAAPQLAVEPILGRGAVRVRLFDPASPNRRAKPRGVAGATLLTFVGEAEPEGSSHWSFGRSTTRTTAVVALPEGGACGARVWVTAFWFSPTGRRGPASAAVPTRGAGGWGLAAAKAA